jgi:signal transduction histidine kinase
MVINDYIRNAKLKNQTKYECISLLFSICIASILQYFVSEVNTAILMYSFLFKIFDLEKSVLKTFILIHSLLYFLVAILTIKIKIPDLYIGDMILFFIIQLFAYCGLTGMLYNQKTLEIEKEEVKQLNEKLKLANLKLQEYALEIEEVTISKERTRVSQELHDSLGHSLMALAMHLEFAKKICAAKPQKVEEVLAQSERIAKASINDLRKAVTLLSSEYEIKDFDASIEKLINNFYLFSNIKINFTKNKNINDLSPTFKTSIYKTIQESITNSLKHGNATEINIKIKTTSESLELVIADNGTGCNNVIKSNGLNGIENRINSLGGTTCYFSHDNLGFGVKVLIPV